jgi:sulfate adenylyltransferase subunit 1 (EFTu-like GTPase family)
LEGWVEENHKIHMDVLKIATAGSVDDGKVL